MRGTVIMEQERELNLEEVAERLRVSTFTARRRILAGRIRARKEGKGYRVKESDLETYIRSTYLNEENQGN